MTEINKYIELLIRMISIPAPSRKEEKRASFLQNWLMNDGFSVIRIKNNLVVSGSGDPVKAKLLLNSHMDTIPPGDGWITNPHEPIINNGKITGIGSNDAGASVVSLIAAYEYLCNAGLSEKVVLVISTEEEVSGKNGIEAVLEGLPSLELALVGEPTGMQPAVAERGLMVIDAVAHGEMGHAARNEGKNAIYHALSDIEQIKNITFSKASRWLNDPSMAVTMIAAGTAHNVVPAKCHFVIDVRSNDRYSNENLIALLRNICSSELNPRSLRLASSFLEDKHPLFSILDEEGFIPFGSPTLSDMALLKVPSLKIGPGDSARSHTAGEYILEKEIAEGIDKYNRLILKIINYVI